MEKNEVMTMEQILALRGEKKSAFAAVAEAAGTVESSTKLLTQLTTEEVLMRPLHITHVEISEAVDSKTGLHSQYPTVTFEEIPDSYYNGGTMLSKNVYAWAAAFGDIGESGGITDRQLPGVNAMIQKEGPIGVVFYEKKNSDKDKSRRDYVMVALL